MVEKAKIDPLEDLKKLLVDGSITTEILYQGHRYTFASLSEEEECWRDKYVAMETPLAMATSKRAPTLAISLKELDKIPVADLFEDLKEILSERTKKFIVAERLYEETFSKMKREHISELYREYVLKIDKPVQEAVDQIKKS